MTSFTSSHSLRLAAVALVAVSTAACSGSTQKPAEDPVEPALLEPQGEEEQAPSSPEVEKAMEAIKAERFADAEGILAKATKDSPEDPQAAYYYGVSLEGVGKDEEAAGEYRRAIDLSPKIIEASQNLSALLLRQEKFEEALAVAEKALKLLPEDPPLLGNRALALDMLEKPEAIGAYEALLKVAPDDQNNRFNYAVVLFLNERPDDAKKALAAIKTSDMTLLADVGNLYMKMKDAPGCIASWDAAIAANKSAEALVHRARCKLGSGDTAGGTADIEEAVKTEPEASIGHFYLGKIHQKAGKAAEAKASFQKAVEVGKGDAFAKAAEKELSK